ERVLAQNDILDSANAVSTVYDLLACPEHTYLAFDKALILYDLFVKTLHTYINIFLTVCQDFFANSF
ncbi:MAG: hypothetical protein IJB88_00375, partial [Clostridia bacterium]|nr:hypothetical protein [Clostridia bacterium]